MSTELTAEQALWEKLNKETARISWIELAPQFAGGHLIFVEQTLDLIDIAINFSNDNHTVISGLLEDDKINKVNDAQAQIWHTKNQQFWAVVIKPWVLIQPLTASK